MDGTPALKDAIIKKLAEILNVPIWELHKIVSKLEENKILSSKIIEKKNY